MRHVAVLAIALCLSTSAFAARARERSRAVEADAESLRKKARSAMRMLDFEAAVPLLTRALKAGPSSNRARAELHVDLGVCHANLGDTGAAQGAFERALEADSLIELPAGTSPKIRGVFDSVRKSLVSRNAPPPTAPALPAPAAAASVPPPSPGAPALTAQVERRGPGAGTLVAGGVAVVALAAGIGTGLASASAAKQLGEGLHDRPEVDDLVSRQKTLGWVSVGSYALAGVAAATGAALLFWPRSSGETVTLSGAASPRGATAVLRWQF